MGFSESDIGRRRESTPEPVQSEPRLCLPARNTHNHLSAGREWLTRVGLHGHSAAHKNVDRPGGRCAGIARARQGECTCSGLVSHLCCLMLSHVKVDEIGEPARTSGVDQSRGRLYSQRWQNASRNACTTDRGAIRPRGPSQSARRFCRCARKQDRVRGRTVGQQVCCLVLRRVLAMGLSRTCLWNSACSRRAQ